MAERQARDFDRIVATQFDIAEAVPAADHARSRRTGWRLGFGLVAAAALLTIAWFMLSPDGTDGIGPPAPTASSRVAPPPVAAPAAPPAVAPTQAPWRDAELAAARRTAQDILAQVTEQKRVLESRRVDLWGAEPFAAALAVAEAGDALYLEREFETAQERYREAVAQLEALGERLPIVVEDAVVTGQAALEAGNAAAAAAAFERALAIDPDHAMARAGLARAAVADEVNQLLVTAMEQEGKDQLEAAKRDYQRALELDGQSAAARQGVQRIEAALLARAYTAAMSDGYRALTDGRLDAAARAFEQALTLKPAAQDARQALAMAANRKLEAAIQTWLGKATQSETDERWPQAMHAYQQVLMLDASVAAANTGVARARARAELDQRLTGAIASPERLQDETVYQETRGLLDRARAVAQAGPRLQSQIEALDGLLKSAVEPVMVTLTSDEATDVNVYKVARLGKFRSKQVALKPGRYIAVGTRDGYRDVRREFQVSAGKPPPDIVVACTEKVVF